MKKENRDLKAEIRKLRKREKSYKKVIEEVKNNSSSPEKDTMISELLKKVKELENETNTLKTSTIHSLVN